MNNAEQLAAVEDVDDLPAEIREQVHNRVATTLATVDDVLADLNPDDLPEASR